MNKNILFIAIPVLVFFSLLPACKKKDNTYTELPGYNGSVKVGFNNYKNNVTDELGVYINNLEIKDTFVTIDLQLKLANTTEPAPNDIKIYLQKLDALVSDYNSAHGTNYSPISVQNNGIDIDITQPFIIRQGTRSVTVPLKMNVVRAGLSSTNALGLVIQSVEGASIDQLQNKLVIVFSAKNKYDGIYRLKSYGNLGANTSAPYLVSTTCGYGLTLETTGANSVRMSNQPLWRNNAFYDGFCNVNFDFTFNPTTDKVSAVSSWAFNGCGGGPIAVNFPASGIPVYDSRYEPSTKTVYVKMGLNNNPNWVIIDTLIYCGPR